MDATMLKKVEPAGEHRRLFEAVCSNATVAIFVMDERQHCVYMNRAAERLTGYTLAETQGRPLHDVVHHTRPDGRRYPLDECPIDRAFPQNNQEQGEEVFVHKDGRFYPVAYTASPIREDDVIVGTILEVRDIRQEKRAEAALRASEARIRATFENAGVGMALIDGTCVISQVNATFCAIAGRSREELIGSSCLDFTHPDDTVANREAVAALLQGGGPVAFEKRYLGKDGRIIWVRITLSSIDDGQVLAVVEDITARVEAQAALRASEEFNRRILQSSQDCIKVLDLDGRLLAINECGLRAFEVSDPAELHGLSYVDLWLGADHASAREAVARALAGGVGRFTAFHRTPSRRDTWWDEVVSPIVDARGRPERLLVISRDITERKRAEEHQRLLLDELNHRVKNTLAAVQSIAAQTFRGAGDETARKAFAARLIALSAAHNLLAEENWAGTWLHELAAQVLQPFQGSDCAADRLRLDGVDLRLPPRAAVALAMGLHELAANAAKYGALSNDAGQVALTWRTEAAPQGARLIVRWQESGGPRVEPPRRKGFGSRMIERGLALELGGTVRLIYEPAGVVCDIDMPAPAAP